MAHLFLHFLNRELLRSVAHTPPRDYFEPQLKILCCSTNTFLFSNFANTIEGAYLSSAFFRDLIAADIIKFYAEKQTLDEYWESSAIRYSFDKERYPYIQQTLNGEISMEPYLVRDFSMTKKLKTRLFEINQNQQENYGLLRTFDSKSEFWDLIKNLVKHEGEEAVTMSLTSKLTPTGKPESKLTLNNIVGRLLSLLYLEEIINPLEADIVTGIQGLYFFDQASKYFPIYDVALLSSLLNACGYELRKYPHASLIAYRSSSFHNFNSIYIASILKTLHSLQKKETTKALVRTNISQVLHENKVPLFSSEPLKLEDLSYQLVKLVSKLSNSQPHFKEIFEQQKIMKTILIITATDKETAALNQQAKINLNSDGHPAIKGGQAVKLLGIMNGYEIWHGQCEAGSTGPLAAQAVATDLIDALKPQCVMMPGIAFGLQPDDQKIGDILVSTHIYTYEKERVGEKSVPRGDKVPASRKLLTTLRMVKQSWTKTSMHFGILMSGEKLVDNAKLVAKLKKIEPESIGGEMEGAGLYSAAHNRKVDWIVFKSIVDWGMKKDNVHQSGSSSLACEVLFEALKILTLE